MSHLTGSVLSFKGTRRCTRVPEFPYSLDETGAALMALEFDPYRRPPAARLLAILVTGGLFALIISSGQHAQAMRIRRDPNAYLRHVVNVDSGSRMSDIVIGFIVVAVVVFLVDALTALFSRWLSERPHPSAEQDRPASPSRSEALLGQPEPPAPPG